MTKARRAAKDARYAASEKGRARRVRYNRSEKGRARSIRHNRTIKGRERTARFEATPHRRGYKALSIFGTPYRDPAVTAVLAVSRALPSWGAEALKGRKFKRIPTRCAHCVSQGRKNLLPMGSRLIPIRPGASTSEADSVWLVERRNGLDCLVKAPRGEAVGAGELQGVEAVEHPGGRQPGASFSERRPNA